MYNQNRRQTDRPTDAPSRFERIAILAAQPTSPAEHWAALAAYVNELADLFNFNPPTHNASGREV